MRRVFLFVPLSLLVVACGAAKSTNLDLGTIAGKTAADSSRISVSYGGKEYFVGQFDFETGIGSFRSGDRKHDDSWDQIVTAEATYTRLFFVLGAVSGSDAHSKDWVKANTSGGGDGLFGFGFSDPSAILALLKGASSVEEVDSGEERGVAVTRYRARLDLERALSQVPARDRASLRATIRQFWVDGAPDGILLELAVDRDGLLRSVEVSIPDGEALGIDFFDYGVEVNVEAPPDSEVMTWEDLFDRLQERCAKAKDTDEISQACVSLGL